MLCYNGRHAAKARWRADSSRPARRPFRDIPGRHRHRRGSDPADRARPLRLREGCPDGRALRALGPRRRAGRVGSLAQRRILGRKPVRVRQSAGPFCVFVGRAFFTWAVKKFGKKQATRYVKPGRARGPIKGYTRHGLKRAITGKGSRPGIQPKYIHHAVRHGKQTRQAQGKIKYETRDAVVVLTHGRKVVTTWPKSLRAWNCYICG